MTTEASPAAPDDPSWPFSPAADRNRGPIESVLAAWLPPGAAVLELASGTGQHAAHIAAVHPDWAWQPTEAERGLLPFIAARTATCPGVARPRPLDVLNDPPAAWPARPGGWDAVLSVNLVHIAPWAVTPALMRGAAQALAPGGRLVLYGPMVVDGEPLTPGNQAFDADLRRRDPAWGLRRLAALQAEAAAVGLRWAGRVDMPAHNLMVSWVRPA